MFIFLDTETTGNGPDDRLCQIASRPENGPAVSGLFNPGRPISIDAMVVHHIINKMVADKPPFKDSDEYKQLEALFNDPLNIVVAHNAKFDMQMLQKEGLFTTRVICTLKLARHLDKNGVIPKYNLQYLRYFLDLDVDAKAHEALGDILVLEALFQRLYAKIKEQDLRVPEQEMINISNNPVLVPRMPFGKHKGDLFSEVPVDYLQWLSTTDLDEDMAYTVKHRLGNVIS
jgi:DNA polymerase III epsilon subunit-like protein